MLSYFDREAVDIDLPTFRSEEPETEDDDIQLLEAESPKDFMNIPVDIMEMVITIPQ